MSPFLLLRHLPATPPLDEHGLSAAQRRLVQLAHRSLRPYDLGVRRNWRAVLGGPAWWRRVLLAGGAPRGDGRTFEKGPGAPAALERLARALDDARTPGGARGDREAD